MTALPLCGSFPVEHGSRIRTRPVDEDYTAHATSRLLLGLSAPNSRVGGPKYWSHEYDLPSVQAHGDNSAPVAWARLASFSAYSSASLSGRQHHFLHHAVCVSDRVSRIVAAKHGEHVQILSPRLKCLHKIKHTCGHPFPHRAKRPNLARGGARAMIA